MCKAMEDMRNEAENRGEARGRILGAIEMLKDEGLSDSEIIKRVTKKYDVTEEYVLDLMHTAA